MTANRESFGNAAESSPVVRGRRASRSSMRRRVLSARALNTRSVARSFTCDRMVTSLISVRQAFDHSNEYPAQDADEITTPGATWPATRAGSPAAASAGTGHLGTLEGAAAIASFA